MRISEGRNQIVPRWTLIQKDGYLGSWRKLKRAQGAGALSLAVPPSTFTLVKEWNVSSATEKRKIHRFSC